MSYQKITDQEDNPKLPSKASQMMASMNSGQSSSVKRNISSEIDVSKLHAGEKSIDFKTLLTDYRKRTEATQGYTIQQVEDVMFVNDRIVVSLEYIFYQTDGKYIRLKPDKKDSKDNNYQSKPFGTFKYTEKLKEKFPHSIYQDESIDLVEKEVDYFKEHSESYIREQAKKEQTKKTQQSVRGGLKIDIAGMMSQSIKKDLADQNKVKFMTTDDGNALVEAVLSLWDITEKGQIMKKQEISFNYDMNFKPSTGSQMRLQLSEDKGEISLPIVDKNNKVIFLAWKTKNLQRIIIPHAVTKSTENLPPSGVLKSMNFVGKSKYIQQVIKLCEENQYKDKQGVQKIGQKFFYLFLIFDFETGQKLLKWSNRHIKDKNNSDQLRVIGFLVNEKGNKAANANMRDRGEESEYGQEDDEEQSQEDNSDYEQSEEQSVDEDDELQESMRESEKNKHFQHLDESMPNVEETDDQYVTSLPIGINFSAKGTSESKYSGQRDSENPNHSFRGFIEQDEQFSGGEEEFDTSKIDVDLVFFYAKASDDNHENDQKHQHNWLWSKKSLKLKDLIQANQQDGSVYKYIQEQGQQQFLDHKLTRNFFSIPKSWFIKQNDNKTIKIQKLNKMREREENWEGQISIAANKKFKHFSMLNEQKKVFMVFDNTKDSNDALTTMYLPNLSQSKIVRNQMCKDYMMLIQSIPGKGSTAHVFYAKDQKKTINFPENQIFLNAYQDVQHQPLPSIDFQSPWESLMLQTITLSKGDQEIKMKTEIINTSKEDDAKPIILAERTTSSQKHSAVYPMFLYNIGSNKLVLQNTLSGGKQYIIRLGINETFLDHIEYNKLKDIGFYPNGINIEAASRFAFLTFDKKEQTVINNFLICDPYYDVIQFSLFKSTKQYKANKFFGPKDKDVMVKQYMYCNQDHELKIASQLPGHMSIHHLKEEHEDKEEEDDEENDDSEDEHVHGDVETKKKKEDDKQENEEEEVVEEEQLFKYARAPMIQDDKGVIYYLTKYEGMVTVMEINPKNDKNHENIFEIKTEFCFGFNYYDGYFYFMDQHKVITQLQRMKDQRTLIEAKILHLKDKDAPNFIKKDLFEYMFCTDKYLLQQSKIFYLQGDHPMAEGILDMEQLSKQKNLEEKVGGDTTILKYASGPFLYEGSSEFVVVYQESDSYVYKQVIYSLPHNQTNILVNDMDRKVDMSTFLQDGKILVKIAHRYLLFEQDGGFIDQIEFDEIRKQREKHEMDEHQKRLKHQKTNLEKFSKKNQSTVINHNTLKGLQVWGQTGESVQQKVLFNKQTNADRMKLHRMSQDNKYFLFEDKYERTFKIYSIENTNQPDDGKKDFKKSQTMTMMRQGKEEFEKDEWEFVKQFEIDFKKTKLLEYLNLSWDNPEDVETFYDKMDSKTVRKEVTMTGDVMIIATNSDAIDTNIVVVGCIIQRDGTIKNLQQSLDFDDEAKTDIIEQLDKRLKLLTDQKEVSQQELDLLPKSLQDDKKVKILESKIQDIEDRKNNLYSAAIYDEQLLVVRCGRYVKYHMLTEDMFDDNPDSKNEFKDASLNFDKDFEIIKILDTSTELHLQIIARDREKNILVIVTWDFKNDIEVSMTQRAGEKNMRPENYICKGMNQKRNYFVDPYQIYDLEYNIPLQKSNNNSMSGKGVGSLYIDQRKIFEDGTRSLSIDYPNLLNFPLSRMDIQFWNNIVQFGEDPEMIKHNITLDSMNLVYNGHSLFHYFADNVEVMEMIHEKFLNAKEEGYLKPSELHTPLTLLHPDPDGKIALDIALKMNRPKSFELMVDMLTSYSDFMLSKLMLSVVPYMINDANETVLNFYNSAIYKPPLLQHAMIIPWPENLSDFVFCSKSSILSQTQLIQELFDANKLTDKDITALSNQTNDFDNKNDMKSFYYEMKQISSSTVVQKQRRMDLKQQKLKIASAQEQVAHFDMKRVQCEAIDFDWIFQEENMNTLIKMLNEQSNASLYIQKTIKVFIDLIWEKYSKAIRNWIFYPYLVYLLAFILLGTTVNTGYLANLEKNTDTTGGLIIFLIKLSSSVALWAYQIRREYKQIRTGFFDYIQQGWNIIDLMSLSLNMWVFIQMFTNALAQQDYFSLTSLRAYFGIATFFMWIKVFYWMRLFKNTAYYVKLITQTLGDIKIFTLLCFIVMFAFANLFYMLNFGSSADDEVYHSFSGIAYIDAIISIYQIALGDFHYDGFIKSEYDYLLWTLFPICTFLMVVVFMNMIIAIMGNTFEDVMNARFQTALSENINLIYDHIWLLDLQEEFKDFKYIIRVVPDIPVKTSHADTYELINDVEQNLMKKQDKNHQSIKKKVEQFEKNVRVMLKSQQSKSVSLKKMIAQIVPVIEKMDPIIEKIDQFMNEQQKAKETDPATVNEEVDEDI